MTPPGDVRNDEDPCRPLVASKRATGGRQDLLIFDHFLGSFFVSPLLCSWFEIDAAGSWNQVCGSLNAIKSTVSQMCASFSPWDVGH